MKVNLKVWRQAGPKEKGAFVTYSDVETTPDTSFLETLDILNESLIEKGEEPIVFDHDCREGICGMCSLYVNGHPHGPATGATTCQLYMRRFANGETITVEPWRSAAFPVIKDLMVDRNAFGGGPHYLFGQLRCAGWWLCKLQLRWCTGCQRPSHLKGEG